MRSQLAALFGALAAGLLALWWRSDRMRRWRATWTTWDCVGAAVLAVGAVIVLAAFMGHRSNEWETATSLWKGRMVEYGSWASGAFAIGVGVLPAVALLAVLAVPSSERARPGVRAFVVVSAGAVVSFGWYAAIKGAYLSTTFSSLVVERNLVYLAPLAFLATAYLLERAAAPLWAVVVAGAAVLAMIAWVPIDRGLDNFPYYEAHGLSILALANREFAWPLGTIENVLLVATVVATAILAVLGTPLRSRVPRVAAPAAVAVAVGVLAWNLTAEVYAAVGEHDFSARVEANIPKPNDWIDRAADGGSVVMLGQRMNDNPLGVASTEFWNRTIQKVWSVDGSGPGPGHTLTPDLQDVDGTLWPDPHTDFVLASDGVQVVGEEVAANPEANATLVRLDGPIRLRSNETGIAADGWVVGNAGDPSEPARAAHNQFDVSEGGKGTLVVTLSRETFCPSGVRLPGVARVRIGELGRGPDKQPAIARETGSGDGLRARVREPGGRPPDARRAVARRGRDRHVRAGRGRPGEERQRAPGARRSRHVRRPSLANRGDEVREARAEREPRERPCALERLQRAGRERGQPSRLRDEERPQLDAPEARGPEIRRHVLHAELPWVEVEDELLLREARDAREERGAVLGVVDRAEDRRRRRPGRPARTG